MCFELRLQNYSFFLTYNYLILGKTCLFPENRVLVFHFEVVQQRLIVVLCGEAGIAEIAVGLPPVLDAAIVEQSQVYCDDKRHLSALQILPEEQ